MAKSESLIDPQHSSRSADDSSESMTRSERILTSVAALEQRLDDTAGELRETRAEMHQLRDALVQQHATSAEGFAGLDSLRVRVEEVHTSSVGAQQAIDAFRVTLTARVGAEVELSAAVRSLEHQMSARSKVEAQLAAGLATLSRHVHSLQSLEHTVPELIQKIAVLSAQLGELKTDQRVTEAHVAEHDKRIDAAQDLSRTAAEASTRSGIDRVTGAMADAVLAQVDKTSPEERQQRELVRKREEDSLAFRRRLMKVSATAFGLVVLILAAFLAARLGVRPPSVPGLPEMRAPSD